MWLKFISALRAEQDTFYNYVIALLPTVSAVTSLELLSLSLSCVGFCCVFCVMVMMTPID